VSALKLTFTAFTILATFACSQPGSGSASPQPPGTGDPSLSGSQQADWAKIIELENQAKAIVRVDGCSATGECRTAPVGSRACGGPRYYLVYCARTTDTASLRLKLDQVANAERAYNARYNLASTCEMRLPPLTELSGGTCREQQR
jgi:hypothetical protein